MKVLQKKKIVKMIMMMMLKWMKKMKIGMNCFIYYFHWFYFTFIYLVIYLFNDVFVLSYEEVEEPVKKRLTYKIPSRSRKNTVAVSGRVSEKRKRRSSELFLYLKVYQIVLGLFRPIIEFIFCMFITYPV